MESTMPFRTRAKAQHHIDTVLRHPDRDYNINTQIVEIQPRVML